MRRVVAADREYSYWPADHTIQARQTLKTHVNVFGHAWLAAEKSDQFQTFDQEFQFQATDMSADKGDQRQTKTLRCERNKMHCVCSRCRSPEKEIHGSSITEHESDDSVGLSGVLFESQHLPKDLTSCNSNRSGIRLSESLP